MKNIKTIQRTFRLCAIVFPFFISLVTNPFISNTKTNIDSTSLTTTTKLTFQSNKNIWGSFSLKQGEKNIHLTSTIENREKKESFSSNVKEDLSHLKITRGKSEDGKNVLVLSFLSVETKNSRFLWETILLEKNDKNFFVTNKQDMEKLESILFRMQQKILAEKNISFIVKDFLSKNTLKTKLECFDNGREIQCEVGQSVG